MYQAGSTDNPLGKRPWQFALSNSGLNFYAASQFPVPYSSGLGDFVADPSTLPPAPAGYSYQTGPDGFTPVLVKNPSTGPSVESLLLWGGAAITAWMLYKGMGRKKLPVVVAPAAAKI